MLIEIRSKLVANSCDHIVCRLVWCVTDKIVKSSMADKSTSSMVNLSRMSQLTIHRFLVITVAVEPAERSTSFPVSAAFSQKPQGIILAPDQGQTPSASGLQVCWDRQTIECRANGGQTTSSVRAATPPHTSEGWMCVWAGGRGWGWGFFLWKGGGLTLVG